MRNPEDPILEESMNKKSRIRTHFIVLMAFTVLTLLLTYPLVFRLNTHLAGDDIDVWINPWADWWLRKALSEGRDPYFTDYLFYPQGVSLVFHSFSPLNTLLSWPLKPIVGVKASYNLTILLAYILSGYGMWQLARYWSGSDYSGFLGGVVFAFSPYHMIESAHPVLVTTQWMPFFALYLIRALRERSAKYGYLAAFFLILLALSGWHLFNFMLIWALLYVIYASLFLRDIQMRASFKVLLLPAFVSILILLPFFYPMLREQFSAGISYMSVPTFAGHGNHPWGFFVPTRYHPVLGTIFTKANQLIGWTSTRPAFVGYTVLLMSLHAAFKRRFRSGFWIMALIIFVLLSLGPSIPLQYGRRLQIPWAAPVVALFRHPFRFNILISFCLSILVACDLANLLQSPRFCASQKRAKFFLTGLLAALILFEYLTLPFPTTYPDFSSFYNELGKISDDFALVELPIGRQADKFSMYYQTVHQKRLVGGVVSRTPTDVYRYIKENPLLEAGWHNSPTGLSSKDIEVSLEQLRDDNFRYIVLKKYLMEESTINDWRMLFPTVKVYEDDLLVVYSTVLP